MHMAMSSNIFRSCASSEAGHQQQGCDALLFPSSFTPDPPILCDQGTSQQCFRRHDRLNAVRIATARQTSSTQQKLWLIQPQLQLSRHCLFYVILFYFILFYARLGRVAAIHFWVVPGDNFNATHQQDLNAATSLLRPPPSLACI